MQDELAEILANYYRENIANGKLAEAGIDFRTWVKAVTKGYDRHGYCRGLPSLWERFGKRSR